MNSNLERAKNLLEKQNFTCVLCKDDDVFSSTERGISPLISMLDSGKSYENFHAADKVVGKGAAYIYVLLKIKSLYAGILSESAEEVLNRFGIEVSFSKKVKRILNRDKTGFCPIESVVLDSDNPEDALFQIRKKLEELKR